MNYDSLFENLLKVNLKNNTLRFYILGMGACFVKSDPRVEDSPHAFYNAMTVYNNFHGRYPSFNLDSRFVDVLNTSLQDKEDKTRVYKVFKALQAQTQIERNGKASFKVNKEDRDALIKELEEMLAQSKEELSNIKYKEGENYPNGIFDFVTEELAKLKREPDDIDL